MAFNNIQTLFILFSWQLIYIEIFHKYYVGKNEPFSVFRFNFAFEFMGNYFSKKYLLIMISINKSGFPISPLVKVEKNQ